jgi:hypothetical protein
MKTKPASRNYSESKKLLTSILHKLQVCHYFCDDEFNKFLARPEVFFSFKVFFFWKFRFFVLLFFVFISYKFFWLFPHFGSN